MLLLILGILLFVFAHLFKRVMPDQRAAMGKPGMWIMGAASLLSLVLIIIGYRAADFIVIWSPPAFMTHINNLLMLLAVFVFGMGATTGRFRGRLRHPYMISVKIWAVAHLLVNGDLASILLFGSMLAWAVASVIIINRSEPDWQRPEPGNPKKDKLLFIITVVAFGAIIVVHWLLGVSPLPT